jgi:MFS family permease
MRKLFLLVSAVVLVDTAFFAAIAPLLPKYAADLDLSKSAAGILTASYAAGTLVGSLPAGWLAVRFGVKPTLLTGLSLLAITSVAFGFANHVVLLDSARFVQGIGGACSWAAGMAWLVGAAPPGRRGELLGAGLSAAIVGVLLGPVLGGAATVVSPEVVFSGVAAIAIGLAAVAWTMPAVAPGEETSVLAAVAALRRPAVAAAFGLFLLPALFSGVLEVLVPLRLSHLGASGVAVGAIFLVAAAFEAVVSPISGRLSDRRGRLAPMRIGLVGAAILAVLLPLPNSVLPAAAVLVLIVMALGTFWAPAMAMLSDASEAVGLEQGLAFALANLAWSGGHLIGGAGGARLADATSDAVPYGLMAGICALTLVAVLRRSTPRAAVGSSLGSQ